MICKNCGASLDDNARFCTACGASTVESGNDAGSTGAGTSTPSDSQSAWMTSPNPSFEYDSLGTESYRTPETVFPAGFDPKLAAEEDLKRAKAELKAARKRAGKSNAPKVLAIIFALIIAAGGAGFGVWNYMRGQTAPVEQAQPAEEASAGEEKDAEAEAAAQKEAEEAAKKEAEAQKQAEAEAAAQKEAEEAAKKEAEAQKQAEAETAAMANQNPLIGTWTGELQRPSYGGDSYCFGGQIIKPTLTIVEIDSSGKMKADLSVCFHGHDLMDNPADSNAGDTLMDYKNLTFYLDDGEFSYSISLEGDYAGSLIDINGVAYESQGDQKIELSVYSRFGRYGAYQTDTYILTKQQ